MNLSTPELRLLKKLDRKVNELYVLLAEGGGKKKEWLTAKEVKALFNIGRTKLKQMRDRELVTWEADFSGRNIMYERKSLEKQKLKMRVA